MSKKHTRKCSNWFSPYKIVNNRKSCILDYTGSGVYVIKEKDIVIYVGRSKSNIKRTLYRHFQVWTDKRVIKTNGIARISYWNNDMNDYSIKVIICSSIEDTCALEELLIKRLEPRDNKLKAEKYGFKYKKLEKSKFEDVPF